MLLRCKRSCNLCGDLVEQKDRIQPTSKKQLVRRPGTYSTASIQNFNNINHQTHTPSTVATTTTKIIQNADSCKDMVDYCHELANRGDCVTNEATMKYYCPRSCNACQ